MKLSKDIYAAVFDNAVQAIVLIDQTGVIREVNPAASSIFGYRNEEFLGRNVSMLMPAPYRDEHDAYVANYLATGEAKIIGTVRELVALRRDGNTFPVELTVTQVAADDGTLFVGMINDITERKESEKLLTINNRVMRAINAALGGFINASIGKRELFDSVLERLLEITESEYGFIGEILQDQDHVPYLKTFAITNIAWDHETRRLYRDNVRNGLVFRNLDTLFGVTIRTAETVISNNPAQDPRSGGLPKGHPILKTYLGVPLFAGNKLIGMAGVANRKEGYDEELAEILKPLLGTIGSLIAGHQNLSSRRQAEQELYRAQAKLRNMATMDALTGIANRNSLFDQLGDAFARSRAGDGDFSILFIDIDHFKRINDTRGHMVGDLALKAAVAVIQENARPSDIFGRYGGEEMVLGLIGCGVENAERSAERIRSALERAWIDLGPGQEPLQLTVSIGVATLGPDANDIDALIQQADEAVYAAKRAGRNCVRRYGQDAT